MTGQRSVVVAAKELQISDMESCLRCPERLPRLLHRSDRPLKQTERVAVAIHLHQRVRKVCIDYRAHGVVAGVCENLTSALVILDCLRIAITAVVEDSDVSFELREMNWVA